MMWSNLILVSAFLPICYMRNIALEMDARLSGTTHQSGALSTDGDLSDSFEDCAHGYAGTRQRGTLRVVLNDMYLITDITIYSSAEHPGRSEDITITIDDAECGHIGTGYGASITVTCNQPLIGREVTLIRDSNSSEKRHIVLCEVVIDGYLSPFDRRFESAIPVSEIASMSMLLHIPPWVPPDDEDLALYFYRVEYTETHRDNWLVSGDAQHTADEFITYMVEYLQPNTMYTFHALPGLSIAGGALVGATGPRSGVFSTVCAEGSWGDNCVGACNCADVDEICDVFNGSCPVSGCPTGYQGTACNQVCAEGSWGDNCAAVCYCADGVACDIIDGSCPAGCAAGYQGSRCDQGCDAGRWGNNCVEMCYCADGVACDTIDGLCPVRCAAGYQGSACDQECESGTWGVACAEMCECSAVNEICDITDGTCLMLECAAGYQGRVCDQEAEAEDPSIAVVAGAAGGAAAFLLIITLAIILWRCGACRNKAKDVESEVGTAGAGALLASSVEASLKSPPIYENQPENPIAIGQLSTYVGNVKDTPDGFKDEFHRIPDDTLGSFVASHKPENRSKDRFLDTGAYDHSRVVLRSGTTGSDYINASHIPGYVVPKGVIKGEVEESLYEAVDNKTGSRDKPAKPKKKPEVPDPAPANLEIPDDIYSARTSLYVNTVSLQAPAARDETIKNYIAAQGPLPNTMEDFFEMVWQDRINRIIMVTNLVEGDRIKCERYWPDEGTIEIGKFRIGVLQADVYADYTVRELKLEKAGIIRKVRHFHYTGWPDHGLPTFTTSIIDLRHKVRSFDALAKGPMLVHCSAGVGRTGTFIALDYLLEQAKHENQVDVLKFVTQMRLCRISMVQTLDQYAFVYDGLLEATMSKKTAIPCGELGKVYQAMQVVNPATGKSPLQEQFELLEALRPHKSKQMTGKERRETRRRVTRKESDQDIDAVFVDGYRTQRSYIISALPTKESLDAIWRLFPELSVHSVVYLKQQLPDDQEDVIYWPELDSAVMEIDKMTVSLRKSERLNTHTVREFEINNEEIEEGILVKHHTIEWPSGGDLRSRFSDVLDVIDRVTKWQQRTGNKPIVIQCRDGAELSGLYCCACYLLEKIQIDQEVDVFLAVKQVRAARPPIIQTIEQYKFLHELALAYFDKNSLYANFL